jgi:hypothetical protein
MMCIPAARELANILRITLTLIDHYGTDCPDLALLRELKLAILRTIFELEAPSHPAPLDTSSHNPPSSHAPERTSSPNASYDHSTLARR